MLEPRVRRLLLDALRPPDGYALDHAVGTTYSLDLLALLVAPLAFSLFEMEDDGEGRADPLALLAAVRRHAGRVTVFCQAGRIAVPARHQPLFGYLEGSVFEATAPDPRRAFHPKVWALRFVAPDEPDRPVKYRVLCLSRNLTFDRSWDTALVLDGELGGRPVALNRPLADFVAALPALAHEPLPEARAYAIATIADGLQRVKFDPPAGMELARFWPLGVPGHSRWPFTGRIDRLLVVSPFLGAGCLTRLADGSRDGCALVSRVGELAELSPAALERFDPVFQLSASAEPETEPGNTLSGLHAKVYVADAGWEARVWTGSANATDAAFGGNVEFLVELKGTKGACGVDAVLREGAGAESFRGLLEEFVPRAVDAPDPVRVRLEASLEEARRALAGANFHAVLTPHTEPDSFVVDVVPHTVGVLALPPGVTVTCRPASVAAGMAVAVEPGCSPAATVPRLTAAHLTRFFAFHAVAADGPTALAADFVLSLPLENEPPGRTDRLLFHVLSDRRAVLRLIRLLLADGGADAAALLAGWDAAASHGTGHGGAGHGFEVPLFETLVRALDRSPAKLDEVNALVNELSRTAEGRALLPDGFEDVWRPIWATREELR